MKSASLKKLRSLPWPLRLTSWVMITVQLWLPCNGQLSVAAQTSAPARREAQDAPQAAINAADPPHPINRSVPAVQPPPSRAIFSENPTEQEIFRARVFTEPLLPVGPAPSVEENRSLAHALSGFLQRLKSDDVSGLVAFLDQHPQSAWKASLLLSLGQVYRKTGYFSKALVAWEEGWDLAKAAPGANAAAIGDTVIGELTELYARLGRYDRLESLFQQIDGRDVHGPATVKLTGAREGLSLMRNNPEKGFL